MKDQFKETDVARNISDIQFSTLSCQEMQQSSHVHIILEDLYDKTNPNLPPLAYGIMDARMGTSRKGAVCETCSKSLVDCVGHFGYIDLALPVFHVGYFKMIVYILQIICKSCSCVLLQPNDKKRLCEQYRRCTESYINQKQLYKKVTELCKKISTCPYCLSHNGVVKKVPHLKIVHELLRNVKKGNNLPTDYFSQFEYAKENNKELAPLLSGKSFQFLNPSQVLDLFNCIPLADIPLLCMNEEFNHPRDLLLTRLLVPPNCVRPSIVSDVKSGTNEDDITVNIRDIISYNNLINKRISTKMKNLQIPYDHLQFVVSLSINSEIPVPQNLKKEFTKPNRGLVQRLKGKGGRFRQNLSAKRVDFSARTVISPDPNLRIDEVGIPVEVAKILTYPEKVTPHNIEFLKSFVRNGPDIHPGALCIEKRATRAMPKGQKILLRYVSNRQKTASDLRLGDTVERHLIDGDIVLFNRQPSLHKMSIMSHIAKVLPGRTFRFNECVCTPYNADFDGDEMNVHLLQTEEARAEASILMGVKSNLVSPRNGDLIIGATQDFITGSYLLTQKDKFFDKEKTMELISSMFVAKEALFKVVLPKPAIVKPVQLWTGKQIFSVILRKNNMQCNLITKNKDYTKDEDLCKNEGWVVIRNSEVLAGALDKSVLGSGFKNNLYYVILKDFGRDQAADTMWKISRLAICYLSNKGFSIGVGDVMPGKSLLNRKQDLLNDGYEKCTTFIEQLKAGTLTCLPGCTAGETLEQLILNELSTIRDKAGKACLNELHKTNSALIMAICGSKGSFINISQMIACVGQQAIGGKRVPNGFDERALPHYKRLSKEPAAKGFVSNSFFSGLTLAEFLFHTMGGREGLVDTAVKTAETGYMQRRLVKFFEDLYVAYDLTVRNSSQDVIQFQFGGDGLDPSEIEVSSTLVNFERVLHHIRAQLCFSKEDPLSEEKIMQLAERYVLYEDVFRDPLPGEKIIQLAERYLDEDDFEVLPSEFKQEILAFLTSYAEKIDKVRSRITSTKRKAHALNEIERITFSQLLKFLNYCLNRFNSSIIQPGTAVGALCAQSIGEPATQMTLKTFHFAGVAAMNITLGVPRIREIMNATKNISTPLVTAKLICDTDPEIARQVKGRIEKTILEEVCEFVERDVLPDRDCIKLKLSMDRIKLLKLEVNADSIIKSICTSKLRIKESDVTLKSDSIIIVEPSKKSTLHFPLQHLKEALRKVVIKGLPKVTRAVIHKNDQDKVNKYELCVEGNNFREVIATYGIDGTKSLSNNMLEVYSTLGIEAARKTIINEINRTMDDYGLSVDHRHFMLLADLMTCRGQVVGVTRHGISKIKESVLTLASFENMADHLFDAAYHSQKDSIDGVSDSIMIGKPVRIGTGLFKLLRKHKNYAKPRKMDLLFDHAEFHIPAPGTGDL